MKPKTKVIHLLNKNTKGGAESLVNGLIDYGSKNEKYDQRRVFIAESKIFVSLFKKRIFRYIPISFVTLKLLILALKYLIQRKKIFLVFHLAEGHLVAKALGKIFAYSKYIKIVIYLHQSKRLFPSRLSKFTSSLIYKFPIICYSKCATDDWFEHYENSQYRRYVLHNFVSNQYILEAKTLTNPVTSKINLIFIGRMAYWKRPDNAISFANELSKFVKITIRLVGISEFEYLKLFSLPNEINQNLEIIFVPVTNTIQDELTKSNLLLYLADSENSGESIGIAALEALCSGLPVVIKNKKMTDFINAPGIYDLTYFDEIKNSYSKNERDSNLLHLINKKIRLTDVEIEYWRNLASFERYNNEFNEVLEHL